MKKIIFVTISMRGGGTERVISTLANYYCRQGVSVTILMIADNRIEYELDERIQVLNISGATGGSLIGRIKRVTNLRKQFKNQPDAGIIAMGTIAAMFTLLSKIGLKHTVLISERNDPNRLNHKPITKKAKWLRNLLYRGASTIVLQTEDVKKCFPEYLVKKSIVIPNPISSLLPEANGNIDREKTVISAGRLIKEKNYKLLIDAFAKFHEQYPEYELKIYGKGELEEELRVQIQELGMEKSIFLCGFSDDLYTKLQTNGMYVSSSDSEGISNSLIEALAMGIPTIATDCPVGGSRMFIKNMQNGILINTGDEKALIEAMIKIAEDTEFAKKLGMNAVQIRDELSESRVAAMWFRAMFTDSIL